MRDAEDFLLEAAMRAKYGNPSCTICTKERYCLIAFMGTAVKIKPSYVPGFGCGLCDPREAVLEGSPPQPSPFTGRE